MTFLPRSEVETFPDDCRICNTLDREGESPCPCEDRPKQRSALAVSGSNIWVTHSSINETISPTRLDSHQQNNSDKSKREAGHTAKYDSNPESSSYKAQLECDGILSIHMDEVSANVQVIQDNMAGLNPCHKHLLPPLLLQSSA